MKTYLIGFWFLDDLQFEETVESYSILGALCLVINRDPSYATWCSDRGFRITICLAPPASNVQ